VVLAGGVGVVVVVAFVVAVALGGHTRQVPGDRVALVRADGPAGVAVLAGRCRDQRVRSVEVTDAEGAVRWRAVSAKGAIARRWVVGGDAPVDGTVEVRLVGELRGEVTATVAFVDDRSDGGADQTVVDARTVTLPLAGYGLMLLRWWRGRRRPI
jgi:hypothetical protein